MLRTLLAASLAPASALALAGCACDLEDAGEIAGEAIARQEAGDRTKALAGFAEAGACVVDAAADDPASRYLLAAIYYRFHVLGAPASFPPGDEAFDWAMGELRKSEERDFLELAFHEILWLEEKSFSPELIPPWATVDRLLVAADVAASREAGLAEHLPASVRAGVPRPLSEALLRIAACDVQRAWSVQAWRRARESGVPPEPEMRRVAAAYRAIADAWATIAAEPGVGSARREEFEAEASRHRNLADRVAVSTWPEDLNDPVGREMLKLVAEEHMSEGRRLATDAFAEKQARNFGRARTYVREALGHFALGIIVGVTDELDLKSAQGYIGELVSQFWEMSK
jgi:hypothetical protein